MSDAAVATIVLLVLAFIAVSAAWAITSSQAEYKRNIEKIDDMSCRELLIYVMDDNNPSQEINYAQEHFLLQGCLE